MQQYSEDFKQKWIARAKSFGKQSFFETHESPMEKYQKALDWYEANKDKMTPEAKEAASKKLEALMLEANAYQDFENDVKEGVV